MEHNKNRNLFGIFTNNLLIIWCYVLNLVVPNVKMMYYWFGLVLMIWKKFTYKITRA